MPALLPPPALCIGERNTRHWFIFVKTAVEKQIPPETPSVTLLAGDNDCSGSVLDLNPRLCQQYIRQAIQRLQNACEYQITF